MPATDWNPLLRDQFEAPYWEPLCEFVDAERARHPVYPAPDRVFAALHLTAYAETRVVILGQDPYHGAGQAHGLSFSVPESVAVPPSLTNIHRELHDDLGLEPPGHGNLEAWARRGVLLLNTTLTVRGGEAGSHQGRGWERFTGRILEVIDAKDHPVVFLLWGAAAQRAGESIDTDRHRVIASPHPSPLSAHRGFFGSRPFSRANDALVAGGLEPIDWSLR
jgi:uracil-DNA glycosylase